MLEWHLWVECNSAEQVAAVVGLEWPMQTTSWSYAEQCFDCTKITLLNQKSRKRRDLLLQLVAAEPLLPITMRSVEKHWPMKSEAIVGTNGLRRLDSIAVVGGTVDEAARFVQLVLLT